MTALPFDITLPIGGPKVRAVKFTPERLEQIRNLVERGHKREDIAAVIGCTVGSLQVTCSRFGISLRQPKRNVAAPAYFPPAPVPVPVQLPKTPSATYTLRIDFAGKVRDVPLTIPADAIASLACAAEVRGVKLGEMLATALADGIRTVLV